MLKDEVSGILQYSCFSQVDLNSDLKYLIVESKMWYLLLENQRSVLVA